MASTEWLEQSIGKMVDLSHEVIMNTLAEPAQQPMNDDVYHLTCMNIIGRFSHISERSNLTPLELGIIADYLLSTYGPLPNELISTDISPPTLHEEQSQLPHEKLDLDNEYVSDDMDFKMRLLDSTNEYIFGTIKLTEVRENIMINIRELALTFFGQALSDKDTQLTHLSLSNSNVASGMLIAFLKYLPESRIVSLNLPKILERKIFYYVDDSSNVRVYGRRDDDEFHYYDRYYYNNDDDGDEDYDRGCFNKLYKLCCGSNRSISYTSSEVDHSDKSKDEPEVQRNNCLQYLASILKDTEINSLDLNGNAINLEMLSCFLEGTKISSLGLRGCRVKSNGLNSLASVLKSTNITSIDLSENLLDCKRLKIFVEGLEGTKITSLNLSSNKIGVDGLTCLGAVLKNTNIITIDLSRNGLNCDCLKAFAPHLVNTNVTSLNLRTNQIGIDGVKSLAHVLKDTLIETIDLGENILSYESVNVLANCLLDKKIKSLCLRGNDLDIDRLNCLTSVLKQSIITSLDVGKCNLQSDSVKLLAPELVGSHIQSLNLSHNYIGVDGINSLADILNDTDITSLDLSHNGVENINICLKIFACLNARDSKIDYLRMGENKIDYEYLANILKDCNFTSIDLDSTTNNIGLEKFTSNLDISNISSLNLSGNHCGETLQKLASVLKFTSITSLNLAKYYLPCNSLTDLLLCLPDTKITSLNLSENNICGNIFYLASVLKYTKITSIDLSGCGIGEDYDEINMVQMLIDSSDTSLDLRYKCLCYFSICYLASQLRHTRIMYLNLTGNEIVYNGMKYLSQGLLGSQIVALDLSGDKIDCSGVYYLAEVLRNTQISLLNLSNNKIACKGIRYLAEGLVGSSISSLNLSNNKIACEGLKYLTERCQLQSLDLSKNLIKDQGIQYLAENVANIDIFKINLCKNIIGKQVAYQLLDGVKRKRMNPLSKVFLDVTSDLTSYISLYKYPGCLVEISEPCSREDVNCLIDNIHRTLGRPIITKLIVYGEHFEHLLGQFDNIDITELEIEHYFEEHHISPILVNSNIAVLNLDWDEGKILSKEKLILKVKAISLKIKTESFSGLTNCGFKSALNKSNIVYLDLSNNKLKDDGFEILVELLKDSKIISLNLSNNSLTESCVVLLAKVLAQTRITYIDLHGNGICYLGNAYSYLVKAACESSVCWISLDQNEIEEGSQENIELLHLPYIVPRNDTPIEFQIRFLFRELVSVDSAGDQFEFIVPRDDSDITITISHYPLLFKYLPEYKMHIYDHFYMQSMRRHDIHVLKRVNSFVENMKTKFNKFIEDKMLQLAEKFGHDSFVRLVKECDRLDLSDFVIMLLCHRPLYYVDSEENFLHPFIYKMLHKYELPLYNAIYEPNKKHQIISYFEEHSDFDCSREIIDLLSLL
ncbi:uncharacterized protein LOC111051306 [Nilaparvata lugens]|uniref:uncharacterized protein LOC111051306 n=1 Tax=Nilaparvata lugens TaxID=108931 RepID=UPI00193CCF1E|nr:uncharacterized protein LOC111051306 [Nilaparvata lugens]